MTDFYPATLAGIRKLLVGLLLAGLIGTTTELWLIGHHEDFWQWIPLAVMVAAALAGVWLLTTWSASATLAFRGMMALLLVAGVVGAVLHYRANMEFQLEMDSSLGGLDLMMKVLHAKAPPALAPGNMAMLGLMGLVAAWRSEWSDV